MGGNLLLHWVGGGGRSILGKCADRAADGNERVRLSTLAGLVLEGDWGAGILESSGGRNAIGQSCRTVVDVDLIARP